MPLSDYSTLRKMQGEIKAPATYKDPEKIKEYIKEKELKMLDETTLNPLTSRVACISWIAPDGEIITAWNRDKEPEIIRLFIEASAPMQEQLAGYNIRKFDLPYLFIRSLILNVPDANLLNVAKRNCYDPYDIAGQYFSGMKQDNLVYAKLGYERKYPFISYSEFRFEKSEEEYLAFLIKHNREDVWMLGRFLGVEVRDYE